MGALTAFSGERSDSKVAAVFEHEATARDVARDLRGQLGLLASQVLVVAPGDRHPGRKLEPEGQGILRTLVIAHRRMALVGMAIGALAYLAMRASGLAAISSAPWLSAAVIIGYGAVFGLLAGGLVSLRPDHDPYILKVQAALERGHHAVVVHAFDAGQREGAGKALAARGGMPVRTL